MTLFQLQVPKTSQSSPRYGEWSGTGTRPDTYGGFDFDQEENGKLSRDTSSSET